MSMVLLNVMLSLTFALCRNNKHLQLIETATARMWMSYAEYSPEIMLLEKIRGAKKTAYN